MSLIDNHYWSYRSSHSYISNRGSFDEMMTKVPASDHIAIGVYRYDVEEFRGWCLMYGKNMNYVIIPSDELLDPRINLSFQNNNPQYTWFIFPYDVRDFPPNTN